MLWKTRKFLRTYLQDIPNTAGDVGLKGLQSALQYIQCVSEPEKREQGEMVV